MSKSRKIGISIFLGCLAILTGLLLSPGSGRQDVQAQTTQTPDNRQTVTVTGSGSADAAPDQAVIVMGVQTQAETASQALADNNEQMDALLTSLRTAGIAAADIHTTFVQLYPQFNPQPTPLPDQTQTDQEQDISGYVAVNTVEVTVRDLDNLGSLLDESVTAGGNRIDFINFDVSNPNQVLEQARRAAYQNATQKATQLAGLAGLELGDVVNIVETSYFPSPVMNESMMQFDQAQRAVPISPGSRTYTIDIQVTFLLESEQ